MSRLTFCRFLRTPCRRLSVLSQNPKVISSHLTNLPTQQQKIPSLTLSTLKPSWKSAYINCFSTLPSNEPQVKASEVTAQEEPEFRLIYRYPLIAQLALFCRFKIFLTGAGLAGIPLFGIISIFKEIDPETLGIYVGLIFAMSTTLMIFGEFVRRVIGIIYLSRDGQRVRIAHLSFWGNRLDFIARVEDIKCISDTNENTNDLFWRVYFFDPSYRTSFISTRHGNILDPDGFTQIFGDMSVQRIKDKE